MVCKFDGVYSIISHLLVISTVFEMQTVCVLNVLQRFSQTQSMEANQESA